MLCGTGAASANSLRGPFLLCKCSLYCQQVLLVLSTATHRHSLALRAQQVARQIQAAAGAAPVAGGLLGQLAAAVDLSKVHLQALLLAGCGDLQHPAEQEQLSH